MQKDMLKLKKLFSLLTNLNLTYTISKSESGCKGTIKVKYEKDFLAFRINQELTFATNVS